MYFDAGSFSVPADWLAGDPAAWCGTAHPDVPHYTVPGDGGSISIGCGNPQTGYGASVRAESIPITHPSGASEYESLDDQHTYRTHAWIASAPVGDDYSLTVVAEGKQTAAMVIDSLKVTN
jgi:hypothetical protein